MSFEPMRQSTSLYEKISEALEPCFLTQDEHDELLNAIDAYLADPDNDEINPDIDLFEIHDRLENIVLTPQEDS